MWSAKAQLLRSAGGAGAITGGHGGILADLPEHIPQAGNPKPRCAFPPYITLEEVIKEAILQARERHHGNVKKTAATLRLHRPTLYRKLKKYGIRGEKLVE